MLFKDLNVGDVFKLIKGDITFIKINTVNDNEYPFRRYHNYPSNVLILDKQHYGVISPRAEVYRIKEYHGQEQEKVPLKELYKKYCSSNSTNVMKLTTTKEYDTPLSCGITYTMHDCETTWKMLNDMGNMVKKVIFNDPATIVIWGDGSKTVVKRQNGEKFDKEKGLALCYMKKMLGNKSNFNNVFKEWIKPEVTGVYDERHPELGIQDIPSKNKMYPANVVRIKDVDLKFIHKYMRDNGITYQHISNVSGLHIDTVKRALTGCPALKTTMSKISEYFDFPIDTTGYAKE